MVDDHDEIVYFLGMELVVNGVQQLHQQQQIAVLDDEGELQDDQEQHEVMVDLVL